jgi:hypothetical protein
MELYAYFNFPYNGKTLETTTKGKKLMNKVLIGIGIILSAYLIYSAVNSDDESTAITSEKVLDKQEITQNAAVIEEVVEDVYDNKSATIEGRYILNITTDTTETSQVFDFNSNGTFELNRKMISPNPALAGNIEGTYTITGNTINLVFPANRDKDTFSVDTAEMKIKSETELEYGGFIAVLD